MSKNINFEKAVVATTAVSYDSAEINGVRYTYRWAETNDSIRVRPSIDGYECDDIVVSTKNLIALAMRIKTEKSAIDKKMVKSLLPQFELGKVYSFDSKHTKYAYTGNGIFIKLNIEFTSYTEMMYDGLDWERHYNTPDDSYVVSIYDLLKDHICNYGYPPVFHELENNWKISELKYSEIFDIPDRIYPVKGNNNIGLKPDGTTDEFGWQKFRVFRRSDSDNAWVETPVYKSLPTNYQMSEEIEIGPIKKRATGIALRKDVSSLVRISGESEVMYGVVIKTHRNMFEIWYLAEGTEKFVPLDQDKLGQIKEVSIFDASK